MALNNLKRVVPACCLMLLILVSSALAEVPAPGARIAVFTYAEHIDSDDQRQIIFTDQIKPYLENKLLEQNMGIESVSSTPLISKTVLEYTLVENAALKEQKTESGKLYLEMGNQGSVKIESTQGLPAYTSMEVSSISWLIDQEKALTIARESNKCDYVLLAKAFSQDITNTLSNRNQLSGQRSVRCEVMLTLINLKTSQQIKSFADELTIMDSSGLRAANRGWKALSDKAVNNWFNK